jgi:hypothetical protein
MKSPPGSEPGWVSSAYVAYWLPVNLMAAEAPKATKSQPTGLYGLREATKAPTVAKGTAVERTRGTRATSLTGHSRNPRQIPATIRPQKVQANPAAGRPDSSTPRPCSLAPTVTSPLYNSTVSRALRQPLRGRLLTRCVGCFDSWRTLTTTSLLRWSPFLSVNSVPHMLNELLCR